MSVSRGTLQVGSHKRAAILPRTEVHTCTSFEKKKEGGRRDLMDRALTGLLQRRPRPSGVLGSVSAGVKSIRETGAAAADLHVVAFLIGQRAAAPPLCLSSRLGSTRLRASTPPNFQRRRLPSSVPRLISVSGSIISAAGRLGDAGSGVPKQGPYFWVCAGCVWVW